jgi:hypothetical protein
MPGTVGATPVAAAPEFSHSETAACPRSSGNDRPAVPDRLPAGIRPQGYCGMVQMGPQADAPCLGLGHLLPMNALIEMCGSRNGTRALGGRPSVVPASRSGGHLKETRCAPASIQRG